MTKLCVEAVLAVDSSVSSLRMLDPMVQAFCRGKKADLGQVNRLSFAVDAVVAYCAKVLRDNQDPSFIQIVFGSTDSKLEVLVEYGAERGAIEPYFRHGCRGKRFKVTSFEALGLYIARELVESIEFSSTPGRENCFRLRIPAERALPASPT